MIKEPETGKNQQAIKKALLNVMADLRETTTRDEAILASIGDGVVVVDKNGIVIIANRSAEELLGWGVSELIGKKWYEILKREDEQGKPVSPKSGAIKSALTDNKTTSSTSGFFYIRKDGTKFPVVRTVSPIVVNKKVIGAIEIFSDITQRKKLESEIKIFSQAVDNAYDNVLLTDMKGNITYVNKSFIKTFGYSADEMAELHISTLSANKEDSLKIFKEIETTGGWAGEVFSIRKNMEVFPVKLSSSVFRDDGGQPKGVMCILRDITREKEIEEMKDTFMDIAAHDLRTPATAIRGFISRVLDGDAGQISDKAKDLLDEAYRGNLRMIRLVDDYLVCSRLERGKIKINNKAGDLSLLVETSVKEFLSASKLGGLTLTYKKSKLPPALFDAERTIQVLNNLIGNAIKYTEKGNIIISHKVDKNEVITEVSDTGVGISADNLKHVFQKYYKTKENTYQSGMGLGLYISKLCVEGMGGKIWVESRQGVGSTFSFSLQIAK